MKNNNILINDLGLLDKGFIEACTAVSLTMGNDGKLALLDNGLDPPHLSKDGLEVVQKIRFSNKTMNFGAITALTGCARTLAKSGDSTSATAVLMMNYLKNFKRKNFNKAVERGMYIAINEVYGHLTKLAKKANKKELKQIATVSLNGDQKLASIIMEAFDYAKEGGIVEAVLRKDKDITELVHQEGLSLNHGYSSPFFINTQDKKVCYEAEDVAVLASATWEFSQHIVSQIQLFYQDKPRNTPLAIFLERPSASMTEKLIGIKAVGFNILLVSLQGYDEHQSETLLNDVCNFVGATAYNPREPEGKIVFGLADKIVSTVEGTNIIVDNVPKIFKDTLETLKKADKPDKGRIKLLTTRASVIEVGGLTLSSAKEVYARVDDALSSIRTTSAEGYIVGGGAGLVYISGLLKTNLSSSEEQQGYNLVKNTIKSPFLQILRNANRSTAKWFEFWKKDYISKSLEKYGWGYNSAKDDISNLLEDGIIDSKKSIRVALESSLDVAIQMFNTAVVIHYPDSQSLE